ncbi:MAG TPA: small multi-drug export protein, partial [Thermoplasmata archaeon]|nr:small multi-drug export protein [Thermoplasmata archaeon]
TYVALPVQMTGGLFGSVLGRVMGIERKRVFLAVVAGSLAGAVPMGLLAVVFGDSILEVLEAPTVQNIAAVAGILITVAFVVAVLLLYRRGKAHAD